MSRKRSKSSLSELSDSDDAVMIPSSPVPPTSAPIMAPLSYASVLCESDAQGYSMEESFDFTDVDCSFSTGQHGPSLQFSHNALAAFDKPWQHAVIVNLMGKPNSTNTFAFILNGLRRKWKSHGGWKLIDLMNDYFIVKFDLESDMNEALCGGPWILAGQTLVVRKWRAEFDARSDRIASMAVWVRILGLPVRYFNKYAMTKIGAMLGDVVKVDSLTLKQERGKFARVCVEVDLSKPFKAVVEIDGALYGVRYEGLSLLCFNCGIYGHAKDNCPLLLQTDLPNPPDGNPESPSIHMSPQVCYA